MENAQRLSTVTRILANRGGSRGTGKGRGRVGTYRTQWTGPSLKLPAFEGRHGHAGGSPCVRELAVCATMDPDQVQAVTVQALD